MKLLLVEDDAPTAESIAQGLRELGNVVDVAPDAREGLFRLGSDDYDVIIIDRIMPGLDGLAMVKLLRSAGFKTPVLILTAMSAVQDRVEGLDAGADDYLAKPFAFIELAARINALARRPALAAGEAVLRVADVELDLLERTMRRGARKIALLPTELRLLEQFMRHPGQVLTRTMLLEHVWDIAFDPNTNVVDVHISRLRRKLDTVDTAQLIHTVRGAGYMLRVASEEHGPAKHPGTH